MKFRWKYLLVCSLLLVGCKHDSNKDMADVLHAIHKDGNHFTNPFASTANIQYYDSLVSISDGVSQANYNKLLKARYLLEAGKIKESIALSNEVIQGGSSTSMALKTLAIAYLRLGETDNCLLNHSSASCIVPISGLGIHQNQEGSRMAIKLYKKILELMPNDLESRWLLNLAYMTLGEYPSQVPGKHLILGMDGDSTSFTAPFVDIAGHLGIDINNMAGGSVVDDFDNDGYLDIIISSWSLDESMHYFRNNGDGSFTDRSQTSGLSMLTGGLNIIQADYNNDGYTDIFIPRGAWKGEFGMEPNSLIRNNGDGTFTDVTKESGLLSFHPTQAAVWSDFNNDGWLDLFVANENPNNPTKKFHPSELFINQKNGTFVEIAKQSNIQYYVFAKGVTAGDFDQDGWPDLYISTMYGNNMLLRNMGDQHEQLSFENVTEAYGLSMPTASTFATWFFDYNNDGWSDLVSCNYDFKASLSTYLAANLIGIPTDELGAIYLFRNDEGKAFTNITEKANLKRPVFSMAANFGDIDNDGFLDMYFSTGNPNFESLIPNRLFRNLGNEKFADVTAAARVGHLQKGHGVSFADLDNDGDQDIYVEMGGAYKGDTYQNSLFQNTSTNGNSWINLKLEGKQSNRSAIGTQIKIILNDNGQKRQIIRDINSGGSFGASTLRAEIGIGKSTSIESMEIKWSGSGTIQLFKNIIRNKFYTLQEGGELIEAELQTIAWKITDPLCLPEIIPSNK